jgi:hypothetical protein
MKKKILLFGYGKWGKRILPSLKKIFSVTKILRSEDSYEVLSDQSISWGFVATPTNTHYQITKRLLTKKLNVFCEKPLSSNFKNSKKLIDFSKKQKRKLYISDIEIFKNKKIILKKKNFIIRKKKSNMKINEIPDSLVYHDFYILFSHLKNKKLKYKDIFIGYKILKFKIIAGRNIFCFVYDINSKYLVHRINNCNYNTKLNYLPKMFQKISNGKVNYSLNHSRSLFASKNTDRLKRYILKNTKN